jgi:hypothetical protein
VRPTCSSSPSRCIVSSVDPTVSPQPRSNPIFCSSGATVAIGACARGPQPSADGQRAAMPAGCARCFVHAAATSACQLGAAALLCALAGARQTPSTAPRH